MAKYRMQNVRFTSVEEMLDILPEDQLEITATLREIVRAVVPEATEYLSYHVPCYKRHYVLCFIWPGAIAWGNKTNEGVRLGFTRGCLMTDEHDYLDRGGRKQVYWRDYFTIDDVDENIVAGFLAQAVVIDDLLKMNKRK